MAADTLPRQLSRTRHFGSGAPGSFTVSADGNTVLYLRSRAGDDPVALLWALDVATGEERVLVDAAALADESELPEAERIRRERARVRSAGITSYGVDAQTRLAVFALAGRLWTVEIATGVAKALPARDGAFDPRIDPTGRRVAYAHDGSVRVVEVDGSGDRAIVEPDGPVVRFGVAEHVASESMHRQRGHWWSPDGERLLVTRVDESAVDVWYIGDPAEPATPPREFRYPPAGGTNADVSLHVYTVDGSAAPVAVDWDRKGFEYLAEAGWDAHGPVITVQSRDQQTVQVLAVDPADGTTSTLHTERDDCWVELTPGTPARTSTGALVWIGTGDRRLHIGGEAVTPQGVYVRAVLGVDGDTVLFSASTAPVSAHLWTWRPDEGARRRSVEPGVHGGAVGGEGTLVHVARTLDSVAPRVRVLRAGAEAAEVKTFVETPILDSRPELLVLGERKLNTALFLPSWFKEGDAPLPVLMDPYGGSAGQKVMAVQNGATLVSQWFAEQGFAVVVVDGAGTPGRSPAFTRETYLDKATPVLADQVAALRELGRQRPELDLTRVGIRGWSFGGYLAALAVLRRPDVFHAAVSGAPVTDMRMYDSHWQERHLGHPDEHPEAYDHSSLIADAPKLSRPLLLVHGLADDNVFPVHTLRLSHALLVAGKRHDVLPLVRTTHMPTDPAAGEGLLWAQVEWLRGALG
ncbi:S9 family peptidase [Phytomonospora endophytica]|uniref:Dipeptidyl-peptidase-4 n=1 Tax=Phytomonospora endophytica TaxID=714109 RepID=A0A841FL08_9ACTN|nr:prolyl oligopeptidase family serine peptidase [Phytomonospora endophytica]MBB6034488.1 dipeptidyl-peptidase-4 [Phytomonospora endophytica]GIG70395.1 peptidase [Phytomonospora endophytica]